MRAYQVHGESGFYVLKNIWKQLFGEELILEEEYVNIEAEEYA